MSEEGFEVHGPHDHELEHAGSHGSGQNMTSQIAMFTAIIATFGAIFGYMAGATQAAARRNCIDGIEGSAGQN